MTQRQVLLKNISQCCHSSCQEQGVHSRDCASRGPGSRQWCTNSSEDRGLQELLGDELLGGHSGVEAGGRKGRGSDDESSGAQLPKKQLCRLERRWTRRSVIVPQRRIYRS
ncbi:hypothetical protein BHE74_00044937 [Ensete ventricosum]|nr:hypothetical protein BHE74_00044937 [Ensete ventricosum]